MTTKNDQFKCGKILGIMSFIALACWTAVYISKIVSGSFADDLFLHIGRFVLWVAFSFFTFSSGLAGKRLPDKKIWFVILFAALAARALLSAIAVSETEVDLFVALAADISLLMYCFVTAGSLIAMLHKDYAMMKPLSVVSLVMLVIYMMSFTVLMVISTTLYAISIFSATLVVMLLMLPVTFIEIAGTVSMICYAKKYDVLPMQNACGGLSNKK